MAATKAYIYSNDTGLSKATHRELHAAMEANGFEILDSYSKEVDLIACIGGDGTFLNCVHDCDFPTVPIIGINTGHLGFFQEFMPDQIDMFIKCYLEGNYTYQTVNPVEAFVTDHLGTHQIIGLNEILIRGTYAHIVHFSVMIEDTVIQEFSGDGVLVSTPVGSTAYSYALGGSLVAPELDAFQLTPVAPMNTNAYRCFRASIMYPANKKVRMIMRSKTVADKLLFSYDGLTQERSNVRKIELMKSDKEIRLIRLSSYDYWSKLKSKLL